MTSKSTTLNRDYDSSSLLPLINTTIHGMWTHNSDECLFIDYVYGTAIIFDSIYATMNSAQYSNKENNDLFAYYNDNLLSPHIYNWTYYDNTTSVYKILHNINISFDSYPEHNIGDFVGIMPIMHIGELEYNISSGRTDISNINVSSTNGVFYLLFKTVDYYILQYPRRLQDNTISRNYSGHWINQNTKNSSIVWADDCYMGLTLTNRLIKLLTKICITTKNKDEFNYQVQYQDYDDAGDGDDDASFELTKQCLNYYQTTNNFKNKLKIYIDFTVNQTFLFHKHLLNKDNQSLRYYYYHHGYNMNGNKQSCCPWGRANAWVLLSQIETVKMINNMVNITSDHQHTYTNDYSDILPYNNSYYINIQSKIHNVIVQFLNTIILYQNATNGMWHQVINQSETYIETTGTSGILRGILYSKINNLFPKNESKKWDHVINLGMNGLFSIINNQTGEIENLCNGTDIKTTYQEYNRQKNNYCQSGSPGGPGFVINTLLEYQSYLDHKSNQLLDS